MGWTRSTIDDTPFTDLGADYFDKRSQDAIVRRSIKRLEGLGHKVVVVVVAT